MTPIVSRKYLRLFQFCYVKVFSINQNGNLLLLDDPGRVRSHIASVVRQIQRFDFDRNLVVARKVISSEGWRIVFGARGTRAHVRNVPSSVLPKSTVRNLESSCTGCMFLIRRVPP
jgi:hypothetical protein